MMEFVSHIRRLVMINAACLSFVTISACATAPEPKTVTRDVLIPTPVQCRPQIGPDPIYPDTPEAFAAAPDIFALAKLYVAGRLLRIARDAEKTAALRECGG